MKRKNNLIWGIFFVLSALIVLLGKLGLFAEVSVLSLVATCLLIPVIILSIKNVYFSGIFFPIAFIAIMFSKPLGIENITPVPVLVAALFLSIGMYLIFPKKSVWGSVIYNSDSIKGGDVENFNSDDINGEEISAGGSFTGSTKYVNSQNLKAVNVNCRFSGMKIYFDNAQMAGNFAFVNIDAEFSGIELYVPKSWAVCNDSVCTLGAVTEKGARFSNASKTLVLRGKSSFSGITIYYV
ncbi:MAG: LiaF transmembrane domain-containing protein [Hominimerdicola sp.]